MDLKGSLVDTHLKIYPNQKLLDFLKTVPLSDNLPHNILQVVKGSKGTSKGYSIDNKKPTLLTTSDIENLKKIDKLSCEINKTNTCKHIPKYEDNDNDSKLAAEKDINNHVRDLSKENTNEDNDNISKGFVEKDINNHVNDFSKENINKEDKDDTSKTSAKNDDDNDEKDFLKENSNEKHQDEAFLVTSDLNWLYDYLKLKRSNGDKDTPYLHTLLADAHIEVPRNETIKRNPVLEARCVKLRAQQEAREYRKMTKGVDNVRMRFPEDSISYQCKY